MPSAAAKLEKLPLAESVPITGKSILLTATSVLLLSASTWHLWIVPHDIRTPELIVAEYCFVAALSIFFLMLAFHFHKAIATAQINSWLLDGFSSGTIAAAICFLGMRQFGGYDHSSLIQAAWLQTGPLVPFKDYPCTFPPLFFLGSRYAFLLFGVRWSAFVFSMATFAVLTFLFLSRQLRALGFSTKAAAGIAFVVELGTNVVCSFWWHNPITSIVGIMVFVSALVCLAEPSEWMNWVLLCIAFTLLVLSKPNAWPIGACAALLYVTRDSRQRMRALVVLTLGVVSAGLVCWGHGFSPVGLLRTYSGISATRGNPLLMTGFQDLIPIERSILQWSIAAMVSFFLVILLSSLEEVPKYWREYACCAVVVFTSLAMANMNYELKTSDLAPLVVALIVAAHHPWSKRQFMGLHPAAIATVMVFFVTLSCYWAVTRLRVRGIGERMFFENVPLQTIPSGFFAGLHTGPRFISVLRQEQIALNQYPSNKVFFGPRMEFSYAAFHREPPRGLPIWWHPGSSFTVNDFAAIASTLEESDFDLMIFLKSDYTRMPVLALQHKLPLYERVPGFRDLDVWVKRKSQ